MDYERKCEQASLARTYNIPGTLIENPSWSTTENNSEARCLELSRMRSVVIGVRSLIRSPSTRDSAAIRG